MRKIYNFSNNETKNMSKKYKKTNFLKKEIMIMQYIDK